MTRRIFTTTGTRPLTDNRKTYLSAWFCCSFMFLPGRCFHCSTVKRFEFSHDLWKTFLFPTRVKNNAV
jgi:hypothetical protein